MSVKAVEEFLQHAGSKAKVLSELQAALEGSEDVAFDTLSELGAKHGFDFSVGELREAVSRFNQGKPDGELTDQDLEAVAGGTLSQTYTQLTTYVASLTQPTPTTLASIRPSGSVAMPLYGLSPKG